MTFMSHIQSCLAAADQVEQRLAEVAWRGPLLCRLSVLDEMRSHSQAKHERENDAELAEKVVELEDELGLR